MKDQSKDLIRILEEAEVAEGKDAPLFISSFFWVAMRWNLLKEKHPDVTEVTDAETLKTGQIGTWRGHKLFIKRSGGVCK